MANPLPSFSSRIISAPSWEVASEIYMVARATVDRDGPEWARCVEAMSTHDVPAEPAEPLAWSMSAAEWFRR